MAVSRRDALVLEHLALVRRTAVRLRRLFPPSVELDDLIQEGTVALISAAVRYRGGPVAFAVFAQKRIRGAMIDANRRRHFLFATHEPLEAIAARTNAPTQEQAIDQRRRKREVARAVETLPARERRVIEMRYRDQASFDEVSAALGKSKRTAVGVQRRALGLLREELKRRNFPRAA